MDENTRIRGLYTVVKFIDNVDPNSPNRLITLTLGKYGFVNSDYRGPSPNHDEFWLARIDREIQANSVKGCFVLTPVKRVDRSEIVKLMPGIGDFEFFEEDGIRYILPHDKSKFCVVPLAYRKSIRSVRSVITVNFMLAGYRQQERYFHFPKEVGYASEQQAIRLLAQTPYDGISQQEDNQPLNQPTYRAPVRDLSAASSSANVGISDDEAEAY